MKLTESGLSPVLLGTSYDRHPLNGDCGVLLFIYLPLVETGFENISSLVVISSQVLDNRSWVDTNWKLGAAKRPSRFQVANNFRNY